MIRAVLVGAAVLLSAAASAHLLGETRLALRADEPVQTTLARHGAGAPGVVIVFQPEDCLGDGSIVQRWNTLATDPGLQARGLVVGRGGASPRQAELFREAGLRLPLGSIPMSEASLVAGKLGFRGTPFAVVLDADGRVAASFPAGQNVPSEILSRMVASHEP